MKASKKTFDISVDRGQVDALLKDLKAFPKELGRATRNAENTTATALQKKSLEVAVEVYNVDKPSRLKTDSRGNKTTAIKRASPDSPGAEIIYRGGDNPKDADRLGLQHFKVGPARNKKQKGWKPIVKVKKGGPSEEIERGFYGQGKLKGQGIFQRKEGSRKIVRRTGPSTKMMVEDQDVMPKVQAEGQVIFTERLKKTVDDQIKKLEGK